MPQMLKVLREHAIDILTAGMSTRAVARQVKVKSKCISIAHLKATELHQSAVQQNTVYKNKRKHASYEN